MQMHFVSRPKLQWISVEHSRRLEEFISKFRGEAGIDFFSFYVEMQKFQLINASIENIKAVYSITLTDSLKVLFLIGFRLLCNFCIIK